MKKRYIVCLLLLLLLGTACKNNDIELEKSVSKISLTGDLVTKKLYYHNVAEFDGSKSNFFLKLFGIDKKAWIEYTGLTDLSIDLTQVKIKADGHKIRVVIPKTTIHKVYVENEKPGDMIFYTSDGAILNMDNVSADEGSEALKVAQNEMYETVKNDTQLLRMAQIRAKSVIEERIKAFTEESNVSYSIEWEFEDNVYE